MTIIIKNKDTLIFKEFKFKCCVGKKGFSKFKMKEIKNANRNLALGKYIIVMIKKETGNKIKGNKDKKKYGLV